MQDWILKNKMWKILLKKFHGNKHSILKEFWSLTSYNSPA
jgi:hypothetical protein